MHSINLMDAYVIENLRSNGISNEEIIQKAEEKHTSDFQYVKENMDFSILEGLAASGRLRSILEDGYQVTFMTSNGLKNLIRMKYGKEVDQDYTFDDFIVEGLKISETEEKDLEKMLSQNWTFSKNDDGVKVAPVN